MQSLSQICPIEISDALRRSLKMCVIVAFFGRDGIGSCPFKVEEINELLGRQTVGPSDGLILVIFRRSGASFFLK